MLDSCSKSRKENMFSTLTLLPQDPIYGMQVLYKADARPDKINLSIGLCLDEQGKLLHFKAFQEAEKRLAQKTRSKEYLPITGLAAFCEKAQKLVIGETSDFFCAQTVGGTGALYVAGQLLVKAGVRQIFIPNPSWPNHKQLFEAAGLEVIAYPYYNKANISLDFEKMLEAIGHMPEGSSIILQASCHNPTGIDPTHEQWQILSSLIKKQKLLPIFDLAYLGLGKSVEEDTQGIRIFLQDDHEMFVCTTFAKSMGLYNDRVGFLSIKMPKPTLDIMASNVRSIIRTCYSSPPATGAELATEVLADMSLKTLWLDELKTTCVRLHSQRELLCMHLQKYACKIPYSHIMKTKGLFCLLDVTPAQVAALRNEHGIYIALDGRISLAAITQANVATIALGLTSI